MSHNYILYVKKIQQLAFLFWIERWKDAHVKIWLMIVPLVLPFHPWEFVFQTLPHIYTKKVLWDKWPIDEVIEMLIRALAYKWYNTLSDWLINQCFEKYCIFWQDNKVNTIIDAAPKMPDIFWMCSRNSKMVYWQGLSMHPLNWVHAFAIIE